MIALQSIEALVELSDILSNRFRHLGPHEDIKNAIRCLWLAIDLTRGDGAGMSLLLSMLGGLYMDRFERHSELADVDKSIRCHSQALQLTSDTYGAKATQFGCLGRAYFCRFDHHGEPKDLDRAIECHTQSVQLTPDDHADRPSRLARLGTSCIRRFERHGDIDDVDKAIECHNQAVQLAADGHSETPGYLNSLGISYMCRFDRYGELADIDMAVECQNEALRLTPDGHAKKAIMLNSLGNAYRRRFQHQDERVDADNAIECHSQAVRLIDDHAFKLGFLSNLGISYMSRFEHYGEPTDIDKGKECQIQVVQLTPDGHTSKPGRLSNLGSSHMLRFQCYGELADVEQGIECFGQAVRLTPDGHADKPAMFHNLGNSYWRRFERHGELPDVDKAIEYYTQAVQLIPDGHAVKPGYLNALATSYLGRFESQKEHSDFITAGTYFQQAAQSVVGHPLEQFIAARHWARCSFPFGTTPLLAYQRTMELVPQLIWLGSTINRRYELLKEIGDFSMEAASCAISFKAYDRALEWLEEGRSVVWNQMLKLRTPFDDLQIVDPALANRLKEVALQLERAGSRSPVIPNLDEPSDLEGQARQHRRLATEWDQLLEKARWLPGFDNFMRPRQAATLMHAAKDGPVVVINVHKDRCDALIIQPHHTSLTHVPLGNFSPEKAINCRTQLMSAIGHRGDITRGLKLVTRVHKPEHFKRMLVLLWSDVVHPVLDFLNYTSKLSFEELPHVTWCTTGPLSFLPLHATGCYDGLQPNAFDLFVSSYTPTLSALLAPLPTPSSNAGILAVGQEHTKGLSHLPNTVQELEAIKGHAKGIRYLQLVDDNATSNAVLNAMGEYSCIHFACHAIQDKQNPSQSAFHLCDGTLALSTITQRSFQNRGLAFLSACQTAAGDENLPDEAVHLAAGMQMAGYPSVIASMWSIQDEDAPEVARGVYADLLKDGRLDCTRAPRALHKAIAGLRERVGEPSFERWVPFVHMGI